MTTWIHPADVMRAKILGIQIRCRYCAYAKAGICTKYAPRKLASEAPGFHRVPDPDSEYTMQRCLDWKMPPP